MIDRATLGNRMAKGSITLTWRENKFATNSAFSELGGWRSHRLGLTFGFVPRQTGTCKRLAGIPADGSSIVTTSVGVKCAMTINLVASQILPPPCPRFESESIATSNCQVCRGKKCSQRWCDCWSELSCVLATTNTRVRTNHLD